ncbi:MAG: fatty acid hydroxylase [Bacteriovoracaceae bacterium]|nr:fatty acid hydroxylase [Bacteriovoracaceae bacterium]
MKKHTNESIRIFKNPFLESLTHVHPIVPLVFWVPVIIFLFYRGLTLKQVEIFELILLSFGGLLLWTITEYILHRYIFHWDAKSRAGKYFVFLFHGLHHDDPQDPTRLVMPPVPAVIIVSLLWVIFSFIFPDKFLDIIMAYFLIGYLCYDYIHYATHHFAMTSPIGKYLRKYHLQHHYSGEKSKYGVSSPLWDIIFKTTTGPKDQH